MKSDDLITIMGAAVGLFLIAGMMNKAKAGTTATAGASGTSAPVAADQGFGKLIMTWNGWRYYDSGYSKDGFGNIYYQGEKIADGIMGAV